MQTEQHSKCGQPQQPLQHSQPTQSFGDTGLRGRKHTQMSEEVAQGNLSQG